MIFAVAPAFWVGGVPVAILGDVYWRRTKMPAEVDGVAGATGAAEPTGAAAAADATGFARTTGAANATGAAEATGADEDGIVKRTKSDFRAGWCIGVFKIPPYVRRRLTFSRALANKALSYPMRRRILTRAFSSNPMPFMSFCLRRVTEKNDIFQVKIFYKFSGKNISKN